MSRGSSLEARIVRQVDWVLVISYYCFQEKAAITTFVGRSRGQFLLYRVVISLFSFLAKFGFSFQSKLLSIFFNLSSYFAISIHPFIGQLTSLCECQFHLLVILGNRTSPSKLSGHVI